MLSLLSTPQINALFRIFSAADPEPKTELYSTNDFTLLVAIVLSAQATDKGVNKATPALFAVADTPQKMAALGEGGVKNYIKTIGLFNAKAKNIIALSQKLIAEFNGMVPENLDALQSLPGVGAKTARVWMNCARGMPVIAVDTHVFRVANRLGLCATTTPEKTQNALEKNIPAKWKKHAHHWLILHGRYVCKARAPECGRCVVREFCQWPGKLL